MAFKPTKEQADAIKAGGSVLVSAAAGSGKTAVLVERVIRLLTQTTSPISADRLLIVTFTNAAAAEMRTRIEMRIDEECDKNPNNRNLAKQRLLLETAKICTIDSFCIDLLRENFEAAGLAPGFKICDPAAANDIMQNIASNLIDEKLATNDAEFNEFIKIIGNDTPLNSIANMIITAYDKSQSMDMPNVWLKKSADLYRVPFCESEWCKLAFSDTLSLVNSALPLLESAIGDVLAEPQVKEKCEKSFAAAYSSLKGIAESCAENDWDKTFSLVKSYEFKPFMVSLRGFHDTEFKERLSSVKEKCDMAVESAAGLFSDTLSECERLNALAGRCTEIFVNIVNEFSGRFNMELLSRNMITFSMAEHIAFELLCKQEGEKLVPTEFGVAVSSMYDEVLVDEFQDTNNLQDSLFYVLSGCGERLFIVGDAKQSIYGFRNANPENFINKREEYPDYSEDAVVSRILLNNNFRSNSGVCDYINFLFNIIMKKSTSGIDYKNGDELVSSGTFFNDGDESNDAVEIHLVEAEGSSEDLARAEAKSIAKLIKDSVGKPLFTEKANRETKRKASYRDFAILLRSPGTHGSVYYEELEKAGIPVTFSVGNMYTTPEIMTVLSVLKVIDNPALDIPLVSAMTGPAFGISFDKVAKIRAMHRGHKLYSAVILSAQEGDSECKKFLSVISTLRRFAVTNNIVSLVNKVYSTLSLVQVFSAMDGGVTRRENLFAFLNSVNDYYNFENGNLPAFLRYADKISETYKKPDNGRASTDSVTIMSIHKSKGLQFPACILASCSSKFNLTDSKSRLVLSDKMGFGFKVVDDKFLHRVDTPARKSVSKNIKDKNIAEEMRLLYVALTRAEEKLIIMITDKKLESRISKIAANLPKAGDNSREISSLAVMMADSYAYWILMALLSHPNGQSVRECYNLDCSVLQSTGESFTVVQETAEPCEETQNSVVIDGEAVPPDEDLIALFKERFAYTYPYSEVLNKPAKITVTDLIKQSNSSEHRFSAAPASVYNSGATAAEKGTATHLFLQLVDFKRADCFAEEIKRMLEWEYITESQAALIDARAVAEFFGSELFKRVCACEFYKREQRFLFEMPISNDELYSDDKTVVQGAVDLVFCENGELVIVDFKTTKHNTDEELINLYSVQLDIYSKAMSEMFKKPVKQRVLYSLYKNKSIYL